MAKQNKNQHNKTKLTNESKVVSAEKSLDNTAINSTTNYSKWFVLALVFITTLVYYSSLDNKLTNWDDKGYLNENESIKHLHDDSLSTTVSYLLNPENPQMGNYHPLTMISYGLEYAKYGLDPKPYHVTNLILHILATIATFYFVKRLTRNGWVAFLSALLFAIHPMHVESVAWVSERKDVLYGLFFVLSMHCYLYYLEKENRYKIAFYILSLFFFLISGLSKGMAVSLPVALFAIDYYLKRKFSFKLFIEKIPHFAIALILGILTLKAQAAVNAIGDISEYSFGERLLFTFYGITAYLYKFFAPFNLSCFYDYPKKGENGMYPAFLYLGILGVTVLGFLVWKWRKTNRTGIFAVAFFLITIALVLQILPVGEAIIAERYTYIPYIGITIVLSEYIVKLAQNVRIRSIVLTCTVLFLGALSVLAYQRTKVWKDSVSLWNDAILKDNTVSRQYKCRGDARMDLGTENLEKQDSLTALKEYQFAVLDYDTCVSLNVYEADAYFNQGLCYYKMYEIKKDTNELVNATKSYELALQYKQTDAKFYATTGLAYFYLKKYSKAIEMYSKALEMDPTDKATYNNRVGAYFYSQQYELALKDAIKAQELGYPMDPLFIESLKKQVEVQKKTKP